MQAMNMTSCSVNEARMLRVEMAIPCRWEIDDFFQIRPISCTNLISSDPSERIQSIITVYILISAMKVYAAFMVVVGNSVIARGRSGLTPAYNPRWVEVRLYLSFSSSDHY